VLKDRFKRSLRATLTGLVVNVVLATTKLIAGLAGHSHALVADAVESLADVFSSLIVWRGIVVASAPADDDHPYGHGKAEPIAAAVVSTIMLIAAGWIVVQAIHEIMTPHETPAAFTLWVLITVIVVKEGLFRFVVRESLLLDSSVVRSDAWHHRSDAITSLAAAIGIGIALLGGKGYEAADDWAAVIAAGVIAWNGSRLLHPAVNELMDRSPNRELVDRIRSIASSIPGVADVEKCFARKMGYQYVVDMHVEVDPQMTVSRSHDIAHEVKNTVCAKIPNVSDVLVHIEPAKTKPSDNRSLHS
jgi:cation diffusion facilitator family transporter